MSGYDFSRVSSTALIPAFERGVFTTIPYAKETLEFLRARGAKLTDGPWPEQEMRRHAPLFEARFRAVTRAVEEKGAKQMLELAAGLSPRGMALAQRGLVCVEADLEESTAQKRELVTAILGAVPENLHLCVASAVQREQLLACCAPFSAGQPVAVAMEGLLRYLTFEEKAQVASNVLEILRPFGGWWITSDVHLRSLFERQSQEQRERETATLGRSLESHYFRDTDHAREFFESCGFQVESRPLIQGIREQLDTQPNQKQIAELSEHPLLILTARA